MNLHNKFILGLVLTIFLNYTDACEKTNEVNGIIKDFTGLDGCKLLIVLDDGQKLEPQVLPGGVTLTPERKVVIRYKPLADRMSICMAGQIVEITSLRYLLD